MDDSKWSFNEHKLVIHHTQLHHLSQEVEKLVPQVQGWENDRNAYESCKPRCSIHPSMYI